MKEPDFQDWEKQMTEIPDFQGRFGPGIYATG